MQFKLSHRFKDVSTQRRGKGNRPNGSDKRHAQKRRGNASFPFRDERFIFRFWQN
jgi:hypothetical protein